MRRVSGWLYSGVVLLLGACAGLAPAPRVEQAAALPSPAPSASAPATKAKPKPAKRRAARSAVCVGTVTPELAQTLSGGAAMTRACYERLLRTTPGARGKLLVQLRVDATGAIETARLVTDEIGKPQLSSCVLNRFKSMPLPPPDGGCADVRVPLSYRPRSGAAARL